MLHKHTGSVNCLEFFGDSHMFSGGGDGKIFVWTTKDWSCLSTLKGHKYAHCHPVHAVLSLLSCAAAWSQPAPCALQR